MKMRSVQVAKVTIETAATVSALATLAVAASMTPAAAAVPASPADNAPDASQVMYRPPFRAIVAAVRADAAIPVYTVRAGDTLSQVAASKCGTARDWTGIYKASRARGMTARNANVLRVGQRLAVSCVNDPSQERFAVSAPPAAARGGYKAVRYHGGHYKGWRAPDGRVWMVTYGFPFKCGDGSGDGYDLDCSQLHRHRAVSSPVTAYRHHRHYRSYSSARRSSSGGSYHGGGGMESCIIARESGGNSQVMNSSGHYGLYQFSQQTWTAHGGSSGSFGHASVSEQRRVFQNTVAANGYSDWTPYDGC